YQYTVGADFAFTPQLSLNLNVQARDAFYFSDSHNARSSAYELLNANLTYAMDQWRLTLWGRNLTDQDYHVRGFWFGNDPRDGFEDKAYTQLGEPRRYGLTVSYDFR